ncbi:T6SS immunity protein Tli4 family protein [Achromobacter dolens]|uniref:T6SS immunity protein Tli4 family protein n=1 Tax=Achromobacter dolens TaxID=1287738 RepID=UPI0022B9371A|nr:T6SS immunity protein Tli4 family protein [Achromobacter dolens]MCZ8411309.1 T6SS immunity protein Tli4 family protein [Achromobacter dolens]
MVKVSRRRKWATALIALAAIISMGWAILHHFYIKRLQMESSRVPAWEATRPYCFGRFVMDVPQAWKVEGMAARHPGAPKVEISHNVSQDAFETMVRDFETRMQKTTYHYEEVSGPMLRHVERPADVDDAVLFAHWEEPDAPYAKMITAWRRFPNGTVFKITREYFSTEEPAIREGMIALRGIRPRDEWEVPTEPGFCIPGGFIADGDAELGGDESAALGVSAPEWGDTNVAIDTFTIHTGEDDLISRVEKGNSRISAPLARLSQLRLRHHKPDQINGQESVTKLSSVIGEPPLYLFRWESDYELNSVVHPQLVVTMEPRMRRRDKLAATEPELFAVWDTALRNIRRKPVSVPQEQPPEKKAAVVGTLVKTGSACMASGWWSCAESVPVVGGNPQYFRQGDAMPRATLEVPPTLWQRITGRRTYHSTDTAWRLVRLAETREDTPL